jgi:hypothetical protein
VVTVTRRLRLALVRTGPLAAAPQQRHRAAGIAAVGVCQPDRHLSEPLPQVTLAGRPGLPRRLEDLVRVKRAAGAQQLVGQPGRVRPGEAEIVGNRGLAGLLVPGAVEGSS